MEYPCEFYIRVVLEPHGNILNNRGLHNRSADHHDLKFMLSRAPHEQRMRKRSQKDMDSPYAFEIRFVLEPHVNILKIEAK